MAPSERQRKIIRQQHTNTGESTGNEIHKKASAGTASREANPERKTGKALDARSETHKTNQNNTKRAVADGMMRAVVSRNGGDLSNPGSLIDARIPNPGAPKGHNLLVSVQAISVNPVEVKMRRSANRSDRDRVFGYDAVGLIEQVGSQVSLFKPGEEVWYAGDITRPGSYAQYQLVDERITGHAPKSLAAQRAVAIPLTGLTAWEALFDKLHLTKQSRGILLVIGAAGGVGSMLIQLAKKLTGLTVIALASRQESRRWCVQMGADHVIDYHDSNIVRNIRKLAPQGVDYAFSAWSHDVIPLLTRVMRPFGQIVAIDDERNLDFYALKDKALSWHWELMFARAKHHAPDLIRQHDILELLAELVEDGIITDTATTLLSPINAETLKQAHSLIETGHSIGKITVAGK